MPHLRPSYQHLARCLPWARSRPHRQRDPPACAAAGAEGSFEPLRQVRVTPGLESKPASARCLRRVLSHPDASAALCRQTHRPPGVEGEHSSIIGDHKQPRHQHDRAHDNPRQAPEADRGHAQGDETYAVTEANVLSVEHNSRSWRSVSSKLVTVILGPSGVSALHFFCAGL